MQEVYSSTILYSSREFRWIEEMHPAMNGRAILITGGNQGIGQGIAQATLMAYELGLDTCCLGCPEGDQIMAGLGVDPPGLL
jgi:hypothetical protein